MGFYCTVPFLNRWSIGELHVCVNPIFWRELLEHLPLFEKRMIFIGL